jgi:hypothetical protein
MMRRESDGPTTCNLRFLNLAHNIGHNVPHVRMHRVLFFNFLVS